MQRMVQTMAWMMTARAATGARAKSTRVSPNVWFHCSGYLDNALVVVRKLGDLMRTGSHMTGFEEGEEEEWMEGEGEEEEDGDWPLLSNNFGVLFVVGDGLR